MFSSAILVIRNASTFIHLLAKLVLRARPAAGRSILRQCPRRHGLAERVPFPRRLSGLGPDFSRTALFQSNRPRRIALTALLDTDPDRCPIMPLLSASSCWSSGAPDPVAAGMTPFIQGQSPTIHQSTCRPDPCARWGVLLRQVVSWAYVFDSAFKPRRRGLAQS